MDCLVSIPNRDSRHLDMARGRESASTETEIRCFRCLHPFGVMSARSQKLPFAENMNDCDTR